MNLLFYAQFKASKVGVDVSATINIYSVNRSSGATSSVVSGGATTHVTNGIRVYQLTNADLTTYDYVGAFVTTDATVDDKQPPCLWTKWSDVATDTSGNASVGTLANNTITANSIATDAITAAKIAADAIGASELAASAVTEIQSGLSTHSAADVWSVATRALTDKSNFGLSSDEREAVATTVESHLLNEGDSQMLINAIVGAIGNTNMDEVALVAAIRADLERNGGALASIFADYARRTSDYATATNVTDAADGVIAAMPDAPDNAGITAIQAKTDLLTFDGNDVVASVNIEALVDPVTEAVVSAVQELAGTGARTVTVTVTDGADAIEGATVRLTKGAEAYIATTDGSGEAVLYVDDGTWTYAAAAAFFDGSGGTIVVNGDETLAIELAVVSIAAPDDLNQINGFTYTRDAQGDLQGGVSLQFQLVAPVSGAGNSYGRLVTVVSDGNGLLTVPLLRGAVYQVRRALGEVVTVTVPDDGNSFALPVTVGAT